MPELPDLEAYAGNLNKMLAGRKVTQVLLYNSDKANVSQNEINNALVSATLNAFERDGKEMRIRFDNGRTVLVHLMLEGKFNIIRDTNSVSFKMFAFNLDDTWLVISDPKGWVNLQLDPKGDKAPDALSPDFSLEYLKKKLQEKKTKNIKAFLIDQSIVRGIGNAYVDDILWEAMISPESKAGKLPEKVVEQLYESINLVLKRSVDEILQAEPDIINGEVRSFMRVHNSRRKKCPNGFPIQVQRIASKKTYFTEEQQLYTK